MSIDRWVMSFAGTVVLASLLLAHFVSPNWLWLTAFVGPLAIVLKKLGVPTGQAFS
jgi:hypothetical protein